MQNITLVIPVYNDRQSLISLLNDIAVVKNNHQPHFDKLSIVVVDDGSVAAPTHINDLTHSGLPSKLITLKRNVGHQRAIAIGISYVVNNHPTDLIAVADGDGEDRPEDLLVLLQQLIEKDADIVVAARRKRQESLTFKIFYRFYRGIFYGLTGKAIDFGNFSIMRLSVAKRIIHMDEMWMHFPGTLIKSGHQPVKQLVDRGKRYAGTSQMNLVSLITHGLRSVALFTEDVLTRIMLFCGGISFVSVLLIVLAFSLKATGLATPGWLTTAVGVLLILIIQTAMITLLSLLIAMNTRNGSTTIPTDMASKFIDHVEHTK